MGKSETQVPHLISPKDAAALTTLSRVYLSIMAENGDFPKPVRLGVRRIAYVRAEVIDWIEYRLASRSAA